MVKGNNYVGMVPQLATNSGCHYTFDGFGLHRIVDQKSLRDMVRSIFFLPQTFRTGHDFLAVGTIDVA